MNNAEKTKRPRFFVSACAVVLLLSGCAAPRTLYIKQLTPPQALAATAAPTELIIDPPTVKLNGAGVGADDIAITRTVLQSSVAAKFHQEGFIKVNDALVTPNSPEQDALRERFKTMGYPHGYSSIVSPPLACARLRIDADLNWDSQSGADNVSYTMKTVPYRRVQRGEAPATVPDLARVQARNVTVALPFVARRLSGTLSFTLLGVDGKTLYARAFSIDDYAKAGGAPTQGQTPAPIDAAPRTFAASLANAINGPVRQFIADVSPSVRHLEIPVDIGGDEKAEALLRAQAFSEVVVYLSRKFETTGADRVDNNDRVLMALALESMGDYPNALDFYRKALAVDPAQPFAKAGEQRLVQVTQNIKALGDAKLRKANDFDSKENRGH